MGADGVVGFGVLVGVLEEAGFEGDEGVFHAFAELGAAGGFFGLVEAGALVGGEGSCWEGGGGISVELGGGGGELEGGYFVVGFGVDLWRRRRLCFSRSGRGWG